MIALVESKRGELAVLCGECRVKRLELLGSAVAEDFRAAESDLDFLVAFQPMSPAEHADCYFALLEALGRLFNRPVDLAEIGSISNPYFLADIEATREVLYAA